MNNLIRVLMSSGAIFAAGCATENRSARDSSAEGRAVVSSPPVYSTPSGSYGTYGSAGTTYPNSSATYPTAGTTYPTYTNSTYGTSGYITDDSLVRQIRQQLTGYGRLGTLAQSLQIEAQNGVVTLSGTVPSQQDHELIAAVVRNSPGVVSVTDQLQASNTATGSNSRVYSGTQPALQTTGNHRIGSGAAGEIFSLNVQGLTPADRTLAQRIITGLETDSAVPNLLPKVKVNIADGRVMLNGTVQNEQQRRFIEDAVRRVAGVSVVEDQLQITGP